MKKILFLCTVIIALTAAEHKGITIHDLSVLKFSNEQIDAFYSMRSTNKKTFIKGISAVEHFSNLYHTTKNNRLTCSNFYNYTKLNDIVNENSCKKKNHTGPIAHSGYYKPEPI